MKRVLRLVAATALASALSLAGTAQARTMDMEGARPSPLAMFGDALIVRPVMTVATGVGAVLYTVMLPFTLLGGNDEEAAETLVKTPARTAFVRCLGCTPTQHARLRMQKKIEDAKAAHND